jgi:hypothetical protein
MEGTDTLDYRPATFLLVRSEFRWDWSDRAVSERNAVPDASKNQTTLLVGMTFAIKRER